MSDRVSELIGHWRQTVQSGRLPPLVALHGESETLLKKALEILLEHAFRDGGRALNFQTFDARASRPADWLVATRTAPMMAKSRVIHVTDADPLFKKSEGVDDAALTALEEFLKSGTRRGVLLLTARAVEGGARLTRRLKAAEALFSFETFARDNDVHEFIQQLFRRRGLRVEGAAVRYLADSLGRSTEAILSEVDKLAGYAQERGQVTLTDAEQMVQRLQGHDIFELNRALTRRDAVTSLTLLDRMFNNLLNAKRKIAASSLPLVLLSTCMEAEFRKLAIAKPFERSRDTAALKDKLHVPEKVCGFILGSARRFSQDELENILVRIREVDKRLKSTGLSGRLLLEELIITICHGDPDLAQRQRT